MYTPVDINECTHAAQYADMCRSRHRSMRIYARVSVYINGHTNVHTHVSFPVYRLDIREFVRGMAKVPPTNTLK